MPFKSHQTTILNETIQIFIDDLNNAWINLKDLFRLLNLDQNDFYSSIDDIIGSTNIPYSRALSTHPESGEKLISIELLIYLTYRTQGDNAVRIREWILNKLQSFLHTGYVLDEKGIKQRDYDELLKVINVIKDEVSLPVFEGHEEEIVALIDDYANAWTLFKKYDEKNLEVHSFRDKVDHILTIEEANNIVNKFKSRLRESFEASDIFGKDVENKLEGVIGAINQNYNGIELYPSLEEKAAHLLYLIVKDHPFIDGNKRIGSLLFLYYLEKNNFSWKVSKERKINDNALVTLTLLVANSPQEDKNVMIKLIMKLIQNDYKKSNEQA